MTFNELLQLDKEAQAKPQQPMAKAPDPPLAATAPEKPKASQMPYQPARSIPSPTPAKPTLKHRSIKRDTMPPRHHGITTPSMVRDIRKAVRQIGKEAATHRFTREEKDAIAKVVFTYGQEGIKTCENEITRIGINWLLEDYQANGKRGVLHKVLAALQA